jgi:hypothetical protein
MGSCLSFLFLSLRCSRSELLYHATIPLQAPWLVRLSPARSYTETTLSSTERQPRKTLLVATIFSNAPLAEPT